MYEKFEEGISFFYDQIENSNLKEEKLVQFLY